MFEIQIVNINMQFSIFVSNFTCQTLNFITQCFVNKYYLVIGERFDWMSYKHALFIFTILFTILYKLQYMW